MHLCSQMLPFFRWFRKATIDKSYQIGDICLVENEVQKKCSGLLSKEAHSRMRDPTGQALVTRLMPSLSHLASTRTCLVLLPLVYF
ncbi:MAG: hypothetical protein DUD31_10690 [Coriobacteriaceae bacterium]|jgi:hypothetical protein|nr:MAG: hypothetical protein DUD31_10690 [Coriobacteriaceae bacterium]